ncbi:hypothetical protein HanHA300_Chr16g0634871 [Helianthus annuus]|nr:hypothetical protein HanHA300_Chr16g0634871 [Helianthus annuus]KAJ0462690.1 hypothetical protein HanHA89_Chr16g0686091 [Helianthus annuus]
MCWSHKISEPRAFLSPITQTPCQNTPLRLVVYQKNFLFQDLDYVEAQNYS